MSDLNEARQIINDVDRKMAELFEKRMDAACLIAEYKKENGLPIDDFKREEEIIEKNSALIQNGDYRPYYEAFLRNNISLSKQLQHSAQGNMRIFHSTGSYDIVLERGALKKAGEYFNLDRKVLVVTDSGVPEAYANSILKACSEGFVFKFPQGEESKNIDTLKDILSYLVEKGFTRTDCIVAVGGGVALDMAGFAASIFMRGIDFYSAPTTLLSQVDSSIGGKTAIDFMGIKNIVGAFYPPKKVIIDADTLKTLPARQISNGLAEALKMSVTCDSELFEIFEKGEVLSKIDEVIERSLRIKKYVVEEDEREAGLRKVLNFGHTLAHAIESANNMQKLYHGEAVALGMLYMVSDEVKNRLIPVLKSLNLPTQFNADADTLIEACRHDKKADGKDITIVLVSEIGKFELKKVSIEELSKRIKEAK